MTGMGTAAIATTWLTTDAGRIRNRATAPETGGQVFRIGTRGDELIRTMKDGGETMVTTATMTDGEEETVMTVVMMADKGTRAGTAGSRADTAMARITTMIP